MLITFLVIYKKKYKIGWSIPPEHLWWSSYLAIDNQR